MYLPALLGEALEVIAVLVLVEALFGVDYAAVVLFVVGFAVRSLFGETFGLRPARPAVWVEVQLRAWEGVAALLGPAWAPGVFFGAQVGTAEAAEVVDDSEQLSELVSASLVSEVEGVHAE